MSEEMKTQMTYEELYDKFTRLQREHEMLISDQYKEKRIEYLHGVIAGLKFSIRCNGVSGAEVTHETD